MQYFDSDSGFTERERDREREGGREGGREGERERGRERCFTNGAVG
jgi:hypothetical protein